MPAALERPSAQTGRAHLRTAPEKKVPSGFSTAVFWSFLVFAAINIILFIATGDKKKAQSEASTDYWNSPASIDLTIKSWRELAFKPDVILVGSSLMMFPFWSMDLEIKKDIGDIFHHRESMKLAQELDRAGIKNQKVYSLAVFGAMASDAYLYVNEFLKNDRKPDVLVFGIAPRDFHDYNLPSPMSTFSFEKLVGLTNFNHYASLYLPGWQDKADWLAQHVCYFYGKRYRLQLEADKGLNKLYKALGVRVRAEDEASTKAAVNPGFMMTGSIEERFDNSLIEYKRRYKNIQDDDLNLQMGFLEKTLEVCRERGINVVLINMPLTAENRKLFPPGFYKTYCERVAAVAARPGVRLVDLGEHPDFRRSDFWDTTHLDHLGGHKLLQHVTPAIVQSINSQTRNVPGERN